MSAGIQPFDKPPVRGFWHEPVTASGDGLVLTHGAGGNCDSPLLVQTASAFAAAGFTVLRFDLPYRQLRKHGPPLNSGPADRANILAAAQLMRDRVPGKLYVGGHSYGGRQASMLAAENPDCADGLLLLSYPLHPPGKTTLRTAHFPQLRVPTLFVQGSRDPFGDPDEITAAKIAIPAPAILSGIASAGHDLRGGRLDFEKLVVLPLQQLLTA